jgi:hypothetical protein
MDENDKKSQNENDDENTTGQASQIPLIHDVIFDEKAPLKAPPRSRQQKKPVRNDHGPDYDPDTLDLFEEPTSRLLTYANEHTEDQLREDANQLIDDLVEEYSVQIAQRLKEELTDQLHSILDDLNDSDANALDLNAIDRKAPNLKS